MQFQQGTYQGKVSILNPEARQTQIRVPKDAVSGQTIHIVFQATDNGTLSLTSYQRVIIAVR
ncbi:hypothetical protein [Mucilaginibacter rubeus]|uniref:hypothetical protein n=1 Tax=Mucilaginibacter rubeus TaxID=2027860 RepID=UPI00166AE41F|nr:hypothetical protein [Mucilaginibacter rubeus]GGA97124.1 hypothetical protein GCM10011500_11260 [Mucilaginibacter rubeus]